MEDQENFDYEKVMREAFSFILSYNHPDPDEVRLFINQFNEDYDFYNEVNICLPSENY